MLTHLVCIRTADRACSIHPVASSSQRIHIISVRGFLRVVVTLLSVHSPSSTLMAHRARCEVTRMVERMSRQHRDLSTASLVSRNLLSRAPFMCSEILGRMEVTT